MDENAIVEVLKSGLNLASTSISAIVGAVITTLFLRRTFRKLLTYQLKCRLYFLCTTAYDIFNRTG